MVGHINEKYDPCTEAHSVVYFNLPEVQKALHVDRRYAPSKWATCRYNSISLWTGVEKLRKDALPATRIYILIGVFTLKHIQIFLNLFFWWYRTSHLMSINFILFCSDVVYTTWKDSPRTVLDVYRELIHSGLRIWMFRFLPAPCGYFVRCSFNLIFIMTMLWVICGDHVIITYPTLLLSILLI